MRPYSASVVARTEWATGDTLNGELEGRNHSVSLSLILNDFDVPGLGPDLHRHDYAETIVVISGRASATLDKETREIGAGDIVFIPPGVIHTFKSLPGEPFSAVDIHENAKFVTEWVEQPYGESTVTSPTKDRR